MRPALPLPYPATRRSDQVDNYHGSSVADPYRWLEDTDHDDRVVPGHSFKFAATLQAAQGCDNPTLIRIQQKAGHGLGKPTAVLIEEMADVWSFLVKALGMEQ